MARNFAPIYTAIWNDREFRALTGAAQRMYLLLVSQADISAAGTLPLTVRRWAAMAVDTDPKAVGGALRELVDTGFIIADQTTEELLVRSFVRWDKAYGNPRRRPAILAAAGAVGSVPLRRVLVVEFEKVGLPVDGFDPGPDGLESHSDSHSRSHSEPDTAPETKPQVESHSDSHSVRHTDSHRFPVPVPGSLPVAGTPCTPPEGSENAAEPTSAQQIIGAWISSRKTRPNQRVLGQVAKQVAALLAEATDPAHVHAGLTAWQAKQSRTADGISPSALPSFVDAAANATPSNVVALRRGGPRPSRTDIEVSATLALAEELEGR